MSDLSPLPRNHYFYLGKLCYDLGDYSKMMDYMRSLVYSIDGAELTCSERILFCAAAKSLADFHRKRVREVKLKLLEATDAKRAVFRNYLVYLYAELESACRSVLTLNEMLIRAHWELRRKDDSPNDKYLEPLVRYYLQKADCYRYISEVKRNDNLKYYTDRARDSYEFALENARHLATLDVERIPVMLEVALNFSVLYSDILSSPQESCDMANKALNEATPHLHKITSTSSLDACNRLTTTLKTNLKNHLQRISGVEAPTEATPNLHKISSASSLNTCNHKISSTSSLNKCKRLVTTLKNNLQLIFGVEKNKDKVQKNESSDNDGNKKRSLMEPLLMEHHSNFAKDHAKECNHVAERLS